MVAEFQPFPKIARLNRDIVITEKIDGTNAAIGISDKSPVPLEEAIWAQSRKRIITPEDDNFGFAKWVQDNALALIEILGPGLHFGEWWGQGIQRGYGLKEKRFDLFNTARWDGLYELEGQLACVPILYHGLFSQDVIERRLAYLAQYGSEAAPGFMDPEGIVIWHEAARQMFKVTLKNDEAPKNALATEAKV